MRRVLIAFAIGGILFGCTKPEPPRAPVFKVAPQKPESLLALEKAVELNGKDEFVGLGERQLVLSGVSGATLMIWAKSQAVVAKNQDLISVSIGGGKAGFTSRAALRILPDGALVGFGRVEDNNSKPVEAKTKPGIMEPGKWHHLAAVLSYAESSISLYVDGKPVKASTTGGPFSAPVTSTSPSDSVVVGAEDDGGNSFFHGALALAAIHGRALSSTEIQAAARRKPGELSEKKEPSAKR